VNSLELLTHAIAYRPFLDPMPISENLVWPIMLIAVFVSALVYRTLRHDESMSFRRLMVDGAYLAGQVLAFLIVAAAVVWALVTFN
jgi:hypothetical protein